MSLAGAQRYAPGMDSKAPGIMKMVLVPAIITLIVSIVRLVGELNGWNPDVFSTGAPGAEDTKPGWLGISYLVPIFGLWFGLRLRKTTGQPSNIGRSALTLVIAAAVLVGGFVLCMHLELITLPDKEKPGQPTGLMYSLSLVGISALIIIAAWPRLALTLLVYGVLARIPIIVITWLAIDKGWDTHHVKLPEGTILADEAERFTYLAMPQVTFWIVFTMLFGGLFGCLGAKLGKKG